MKSAVIHTVGPSSNLQVASVDRPSISDHQVLVKIDVSAVNPIDTYIRSGAVAVELPTPWIPGCDFAGTVEQCGSSVSDLQPGQRVWGSNQGLFGNQGTLAEYAAVDQQWVYQCPEGIESETCAASALTGITAHLGLFLHANLQSGETVYVNGGTGGVGSMVVQLAKAAGAKVICTAGSDEKCRLAQELGADVTINYRNQNVADALQQYQGKIDVWFETLRHPDPATTIPLMAKRGRYVVMAGREAKPEFPIGPFYVKDLRMIGFAMFNASADEQRTCADTINRLLANGQLKPLIGARFSLDEAAKAHQLQEDSTVNSTAQLSGKIIVQVASD